MEIPTITGTIRVKTHQYVIPGAAAVNDFPQRHWKVELCMLDREQNEIEINVVKNCVYYLHETFIPSVRTFEEPPFVLEEDGWGEFEIKIICEFIENSGKFTIRHPLSFDMSAYAIEYSIEIPYHTPLLRSRLSKHFILPRIDQQESNEELSTASGWINQIPNVDQDTVTDIVQMIVSHPAVQDQVKKRPKSEDFLLGIHQLPDELLKDIRTYVSGKSF